MIRLNLLPHRELRKAAQTRQFYILTAFTLLAALGGAFAVYQYLVDQVTYQEARNGYYRQENDKLSKQIVEIDKLKEERETLLSRKKVVEDLQVSRSEVVQLLDSLAKLTPEGIMLTSIKQTDTTVDLTGNTISNARIATFMQNIQSSSMLANPTLIQITGGDAGKPSTFSMQIQIKRGAPADAAASAAPKG
ncbi:MULTISPECIES: PilN domain-containing protein [Leeia]|uniref:Fimbrial protein n=1 Tax=Leeia aquatica TaxID=2725557 RepID=A0A847S5F9_9NEIS|nr:PilN domain-containing protein [Leeia aquatica]NLR75074.1 fimbrial protein [Leeia aquatica]